MKKILLGLALALGLTPAFAADNIIVNDALGGFKTLACTDTAGVCTLNFTAGAAVTQDVNIKQVGGNAVTTTVPVAGLLTAADDTALTNALKAFAVMGLYDGSTVDMWRSATNGMNSIGTGLATVVNAAQCDDTSPQAITENSFGNIAIDCTNHSLITSQAGTGATSFTRPNDTTAYAANDNMADSTSAPTAGGFTLATACRKAGGMGMIQSVRFLMSTNAGTSLQGELWLFNQSVTAVNDNAAFSVSDGDMANFVGKIPFTTSDGATNNASATVANVNLSYTCTGTTSLRYLIKVINAYTPAAQEVLTVTPSYVYLN